MIYFSFPIIILIALLARIFALILFRDTQLDHEWGIILNNLENYQILSVHKVQGVPVPMIFMPPLYPLYLYSIKILFNDLDLFLWTVQLKIIFWNYCNYIHKKNTFSEFFQKE